MLAVLWLGGRLGRKQPAHRSGNQTPREAANPTIREMSAQERYTSTTTKCHL
jgi:hypothetical protein